MPDTTSHDTVDVLQVDDARDVEPDGSWPTLLLNRRPVVEIAEQLLGAGVAGLVPAWALSAHGDAPDQAEIEYIRTRSRPGAGRQTFPLLICPDDQDFSCAVVVVESEWTSETVRWVGFGLDVTPFQSGEHPAYIGREVNWARTSPIFVFDRAGYMGVLRRFGL